MTRTAAATAAASAAASADTAEYKAFIKGIQIGDIVSVYNLANGATYTTNVVALNTKHITTQVTSSLSLPAQKFTAKRGSGTESTGTDGLKLMPHVRPALVKCNPNRVHRATKRVKINTVEAVEANIAAMVTKANG